MNNSKNSGLKKIIITANDEIAPGVFLLRYKRDYSFIPGQVVALALHLDQPPLIYSIASGTQDEEIWIVYSVKPDGDLTPPLSKTKPGDTLFASEPSGNFFATATPSTWIASGTGIAPFVSMWRSGLRKDKILIHGGKYLHSFYFENEFKEALGANFIRCCSCCSQEAGYGIYSGRVTKWLQEQVYLPPDKKYYLCGSAKMVVDSRDILIEKGIPYNNIIAEIYF